MKISLLQRLCRFNYCRHLTIITLEEDEYFITFPVVIPRFIALPASKKFNITQNFNPPIHRTNHFLLQRDFSKSSLTSLRLSVSIRNRTYIAFVKVHNVVLLFSNCSRRHTVIQTHPYLLSIQLEGRVFTLMVSMLLL